MWAYRLVAPSQFERCETATLTEADLAPGEVLLAPLAGAVCGSDLPLFRGQDSLERPDHNPLASMTPGFPMHEVVGEVVATRYVGRQVGERVVGWATSHCTIAERVITQGDAVATYPEHLTPQQAIMLQTLACAIDSVAHGPSPSGIRRASVLGLGPIGLLFCHVLKSQGAGAVQGVDVIDRTGLGAQFGIDEVVHSSTDRWAATMRPEDRPELVVEVIGHNTNTLAHAVLGCAPGGFVNVFGVPDVAMYPLPLNHMLRNNLTLFSGHVLDRVDAINDASAYLERFPELLDTYLTHTFTPAEATEAYRLACSPDPKRVKVVMSFA